MTHRGTLYVEDAEVLSHEAFPAEQYVLRLHAPHSAARAQPGTFVHLQCHPDLPMRRPLSIMRADRDAGWIELLYRVVGEGTSHLCQRRRGERVSSIGPIGNSFKLDAQRPKLLLLGGGVGIPPMVFTADRARGQRGLDPLLIMGSEVPFPFHARPSNILIAGIPQGVIASMPLMEDWGIPSRLTSGQGYPGCHPGYVTDLAKIWLDALDGAELDRVQILACGPHPMLEATAKLAQAFSLPCQVAVEEFMACGVGGCAGCTIAIQTTTGVAMRRVCVDGPVFDAGSVIWSQ